MQPKIKCKFCFDELTIVSGAPGGTSGSVHSISCGNCTSKIDNPLKSEYPHPKCMHSKHTVYYFWETGKLTAELLILDNNISIHTNHLAKKTTFAEYILGGPMEIELNELVTIPMKDIDPTDPQLDQKIRVWLTFS